MKSLCNGNECECILECCIGTTKHNNLDSYFQVHLSNQRGTDDLFTYQKITS